MAKASTCPCGPSGLIASDGFSDAEDGGWLVVRNGSLAFVSGIGHRPLVVEGISAACDITTRRREG
jgi:hypothetical protein